MVSHFLNHFQWVIQLAASVFFAVAATGSEYFIYKYYLPLAQKKHLVWRETLLSSAHLPVLCFIWVLSLSFILQTVLIPNHETAELFYLLRRVITLILLFWFIMRFIRRWENNSVLQLQNGEKHTFRDRTSVHALAQLLRIIAVIAILLTVLNSAGISVATLLAFGGIGGLAISFAAKDTLSNFIGGLMIFWDRPFSVGDLIRSPDQNIEGTVVSIGWRLTCVRTPDQRPLYIPNGIFSTIAVENPSRMSNRRIQATLGLRYEDADKVLAINQAIYTLLLQHKGIDPALAFSVRLVELGASSLNVLIDAFTKTTDLLEFKAVQETILMQILAIVAEHEAELAYPTHTVQIPQGIEYFQVESNNGEDNGRNLQ